MEIVKQLLAARDLVRENDLVLVRYRFGVTVMARVLEPPRDPRVEMDRDQIVRFDGFVVMPDALQEWFGVDVSTRGGEFVHGHVAQQLVADWESRFGGVSRGSWSNPFRDTKD